VWPSAAPEEFDQVTAPPAWIVIEAGEKAKALGLSPTIETAEEPPAALTVEDEA